MTTEASSRWTKCQLSEICQRIVDGSHNPPSARKIGEPMLSARNIEQGQINWNADFRLISPKEFEVEDARTQVTSGDVLLTIVGAIGRTAVVPSDSPKFTLQRSVAVLRQPHVSSEFLSYTIQSPEFQKRLHASAKGTAQKGVYLKTLGAMELGIAPINEQRRIVAKLDALFEKSRSIREKLDRLPRLLANLQKSILNSAFRGDLTKEWRANNGVAEPWRRVALRDVATDFSYGSSAKSEKFGRVPVLRMGNIQGGRLDWSDLAFSCDESEIEKYHLRSGDVLFNRTNSPELVGKTAVFDEDREAIYAGYLIRIRCNEQLNPKFLAFQLNGPAGRDYCWRVKSDGVSQSNINAKKVAAFEFDLPPRPEQDEIVRKLESMFEKIRSLETHHLDSIEKTSQLEFASLSKAFRGELVPQDPNDEPASMLLERIRPQKPLVGAKRRRIARATEGA